jgi:hypothetical protein
MRGRSSAGSLIIMLRISLSEWQIASIAACASMAAGGALWWLNREHLTLDELELERREMLLSYGRIVDGMLLDGFEVTSPDGTTRNMLLYQYEIAGVIYECSQDITLLSETIDPKKVKLGMPCSIRYQPGSPENSLIVAERWSGLREAVPILWMPVNEPPRTGETAARRALREHKLELQRDPERAKFAG